VSSRPLQRTSRTSLRSPRERRRQRRLAEILQAGFEEFAERGYAATRLDDVGERVSLTKGAIYLYFRDKEELFRAVVRSVIQPALQLVRDAARSFDGPTEELLRRLLMTFYREIARDRRRSKLLRVLVAEGPNFPELTEFYYSEVIQHGIGCFKAAIKRGIDRGEFRPSLVKEYPQVVMGPAIAAVIWSVLFNKSHPLDLDRYSRAHFDLLMNGLKLHAKPPAKNAREVRRQFSAPGSPAGNIKVSPKPVSGGRLRLRSRQ
jgi:AcrR family transcriptional regulator